MFLANFLFIFYFFFRLKIKIENSAPIFEINLELIGKMASDLVPSGFLSYGQLKTKCKYEKSNFLFDIKKMKQISIVVRVELYILI